MNADSRTAMSVPPWPRSLLDSIRIGEAKQDSQGKDSDGKKACQDEYDPVVQGLAIVASESAMLMTTAIEPGPVVSGSVSG